MRPARPVTPQPEALGIAPPPDLDRWISQVQFLQSGAKITDLPRSSVPEIAIAGRSNAGKSTTLNVLCQRKRLAFASKTPGRTRLINLFSLLYRDQEMGRLVDLPGYGYAQVDKSTQRHWEQELSRYLSKRGSLVGMILVTDIRHALGPLDRQMLNWFGQRRLPIHLLLTKSDKLNRQEQAKAKTAALALIQQHQQDWGGSVTLSLFSGLAQQGREPVLERVSLWLGLDKKMPTAEPSALRPVEQAPAQGGEAGL